MPYHYNSLQAILEGDFVALSKLLGKIPQISKEENTAATLWWFVIFPVKLAYLVFFRRLILRVRGLNVWWRIAAPLTVLGGIACLIADWLTCPYFETEKLLSTQTFVHTLNWLKIFARIMHRAFYCSQIYQDHFRHFCHGRSDRPYRHILSSCSIVECSDQLASKIWFRCHTLSFSRNDRNRHCSNCRHKKKRWSG